MCFPSYCGILCKNTNDKNYRQKKKKRDTSKENFITPK